MAKKTKPRRRGSAGARGEKVSSDAGGNGTGPAAAAQATKPQALNGDLHRLPPALAPLIALPPLGILNIHGAILPQYRGVLPSFWMLANGEKTAGVSIYYVDQRIDAGELCGQRIYDIPPEDSLDDFLRKSKAIAAGLLLEVLNRIESGQVTRRALNLAEGSYYSWPDAPAVRRFRAVGRRLW